jgi:hypothetical protein
VVLRRCETGTEAAIWADAYRAVLRSLDIAPWWRVKNRPGRREIDLSAANVEDYC